MKTILIVDDTSDYADNLKTLLSLANYNVVIATDGRTGVDTALRTMPDLILMDLLMPEQDGIETTVKIREHEALQNVPIIFLTAVTAAEDMIMSVRGKDYPGISKVTDHQKLLSKIKKHLNA